MARNPVADHGGELSDLEVEVLCRAIADEIFIQADLSAFITRIEAAINARLREDINVRANLRVEEQAQPRV